MKINITKHAIERMIERASISLTPDQAKKEVTKRVEYFMNFLMEGKQKVRFSKQSPFENLRIVLYKTPETVSVITVLDRVNSKKKGEKYVDNQEWDQRIHLCGEKRSLHRKRGRDF